MSLLANCPQCGCTYAAGSPCPSCRWVDGSLELDVQDGDFCEEFAQRKEKQRRNTTIQMVLLASTGFIAFGTAGMWMLFIYRGSLLAFIMIGLLTITSAILGWCTYLSKSRYPSNLLCPGCDSDLADLGIDFMDCPACGANLIERELTEMLPSIVEAEFAEEQRETVGV